jgi:hypothetical protein
MYEFFSKFAEQWAVVKSAPYPFILALLVAIGAIWFVLNNFIYGTVLANKNAEIDLLNGRVAAYQDKLKGATPEQAAGEIQSLRDQLTETKKQLTAIINPPRDPNSLYQRGQRVGVVAGAQIDSSNKLVIFQQMTVSGELDQATNVEFRNLILSYQRSDTITQARMGLSGSSTYYNARFSIVGNRSD